jgi:uncharacterized membrane protein YadS
MKIYYPSHTRLDGLGTGVLIGYFMQYSAGFKKAVHQNGNKLLISGIILLGIAFWICNEQVSKGASVLGFTLVAISYGFIVLSQFHHHHFFPGGNLILLLRWLLSCNLSFAQGIIHMIQAFLKSLMLELQTRYV